MNSDPRQRVLAWLQQYDISPDSLTSLPGYTNHVFLLSQSNVFYPQHSVLRLADFSLSADLCPLAHQFDAILQKHVIAADLGLAPEVIASDKTAGIMWLQYAGQQRVLESGDFAALRELLGGLYNSGLNWSDDKQNVASSLQVLLLGLLNDLRSRRLPSPKVQKEVVGQLETLIGQGQQLGCFERLLIPIHGDLNAGNLLHDGQRWWVVDWDFAGMGLYEWDIAGLIVEHDWGVEKAQQFLPQIALAELKWFCSCFALMSWHWHLQRGSHQGVLNSKWQTMQYWITLKG